MSFFINYWRNPRNNRIIFLKKIAKQSLVKLMQQFLINSCKISQRSFGILIKLKWCQNELLEKSLLKFLDNIVRDFLEEFFERIERDRCNNLCRNDRRNFGIFTIVLLVSKLDYLCKNWINRCDTVPWKIIPAVNYWR